MKRVFVFDKNRGDTEYNLRLGKALLDYAEIVDDSAWAGIGRSLILSSLSLGDSPGEVKAAIILSDSDSTDYIIIEESPERLSSAGLYRSLNLSAFLPRAVDLALPGNNIWAMTAAEKVSASMRNNMLEISVSFPAGESHYMILRGIRSFSRIQLYNIDYRSDPQFERYDSSGWVYNVQEQTLLVKMRHRAGEESIRIFF